MSVQGHRRNISVNFVFEIRSFALEYFLGGPLVKLRKPFVKSFFSIVSSGGHFVQQIETIFAILLEVDPRSNLSNNLQSSKWLKRRCRIKEFSISSSSGHFIQRRKTVLAIMVDGQLRNISVNIFWSRAIGLGKDFV